MNAATAKLSGRAFASLLLVATLMGSHHIGARVAFDAGASAGMLVVIRSIVTGLIVGASVFAFRVPWKLDARQKRAMSAIGVLIWLQSLLIYWAVAHVPVALALLAFNTYPIWTALVAWVAYGHRPPRSVLVAIPVILIGLALALDVTGAVGSLGLRAHWSAIGQGIACALAAAITFGVVLNLTQQEVAAIDGRVRTLLTMIVVAILSLAVGVASDGLRWPASGDGWIGLGFAVLLFSGGFTTMFTVLPRLGVVGNSPIMNVEPVIALILGWAVLGQRVAPLQFIGALVVIGAVVALGLRRR